MSFWGKLGGALKGIGKVALKAAPIAAAFIPGVGPLAAMGIGAATKGISSKLSGSSWKGALGNAALGGAMGYGSSALAGSGLLGKLGSKLGVSGSGSVANRINAGNQQAFGGLMNPSPSAMQRILGGMRGFGGNMRAMPPGNRGPMPRIPQGYGSMGPYSTPPFVPQQNPNVMYNQNTKYAYGPQ